MKGPMPNLTQTVLVTKRLLLRWVLESDAAAQYDIFSDPEVVRYWSGEPWTSIEQSTRSLARDLAAYRDGTALRFVVELAGRPGMIGSVSLHHFFDQNHRCEIGYALARAHWGHGYAAEALHAVLDYGFRELDLNRIEADTDPRNLGSIRTLERLGFRKEGFMPQRWLVGGEYADTAFYGLLKSYWDAKPPFVRS
jgi:RimJ/RimL family protein N-acetyltransferase